MFQPIVQGVLRSVILSEGGKNTINSLVATSEWAKERNRTVFFSVNNISAMETLAASPA